MRRTLAVTAIGLLSLACARQARAQATLITGLGGPVGFGTSCMPPNDDGSWTEGDVTATTPGPGLDLTPAFPTGLHFYSGSYKVGWINNNGNLSFESNISQYTPNAFPGAPFPMIAPYWADVDTRTTAECASADYPSGEGYSAGATCSEPASNAVWWSLTPGQLVVTWDKVGYYQCHATPTMSFQLIVTAAGCGAEAPDGGPSGIDFDIEFRYNVCGWEAGDASGGTNGFCAAGTVASGDCTPAQAGFDSGNGVDYASLPDSRQSGISTEGVHAIEPVAAAAWRVAVSSATGSSSARPPANRARRASPGSARRVRSNARPRARPPAHPLPALSRRSATA